jgi:hypothetical protein
MKRVIVHIDRLLLIGFRHEDRNVLAEGLQAELTRLLADTPTDAGLANMGNTARMPAGTVRIPHDSTPQAVGEQTARGIAWRIKP